MKEKSPLDSPAFRIATIAVLAGLTAAFTLFVRIPSPARGYFNLGDVAIAFAAYTFGPISALIAGGIGTALADLIGGFAQWAPISLLVHGLQGLAIGLIARIRPKSLVVSVLAGIAGMAVMAAGYAAGGALLIGLGPALAEAPGNLVQSAVGIVLGIPLSYAVARAYPPVRTHSW
jgi:uncharacterized membrane protein